MAEGSLPYHLRPNKAVDRQLFVELLTHLKPQMDIERGYRYVGFGGPMLEDFRLFHERFPRLKLLCIERTPEVCKRQKFNQPNSAIRFLEKKGGEWAVDFDERQKLVVWFDYGSTKRLTLVSEFQQIVRRAAPWSVVRITLNANLDATKGETAADKFRILKAQFPRYVDDSMFELVAAKTFPRLLLKILDAATREALAHKVELRCQPMLSLQYNDDRHVMMTVTCIILKVGDLARVLALPGIRTWPYLTADWDTLRLIDVPDLTLKERLILNAQLPRYAADPSRLRRHLGHDVSDSAESCLIKLKSYADFYRHSPQFARWAT